MEVNVKSVFLAVFGLMSSISLVANASYQLTFEEGPNHFEPGYPKTTCIITGNFDDNVITNIKKVLENSAPSTSVAEVGPDLKMTAEKVEQGRVTKRSILISNSERSSLSDDSEAARNLRDLILERCLETK